MTVADAIATASPGAGTGGGCCLFNTLSKIDDIDRPFFTFLPYSFPMVALCRPANVFPGWECVAAGRVIDPADLPAATEALFNDGADFRLANSCHSTI
ncbi:hypothetical protein [Rhizobium lusitanum]|uniref:Uncharacterized protein n=1 Tax=Rhizobium lusitanum TaxID=293958 RepID=A0A7X0IKY7_9HYPH|nr:hypothetical protein [Rhizobium lusitanum]MBB6482891.1 hypothetical protein [Rhizobium lusitanum]